MHTKCCPCCIGAECRARKWMALDREGLRCLGISQFVFLKIFLVATLAPRDAWMPCSRCYQGAWNPGLASRRPLVLCKRGDSQAACHACHVMMWCFAPLERISTWCDAGVQGWALAGMGGGGGLSWISSWHGTRVVSCWFLWGHHGSSQELELQEKEDIIGIVLSVPWPCWPCSVSLHGEHSNSHALILFDRGCVGADWSPP